MDSFLTSAKKYWYCLMVPVILSFSGCNQEDKNGTGDGANMEIAKELKFSLVPSSRSNVKFANNLREKPERHFLNFNTVYDGGGVGVGDFNNDGLMDIYFTGNDCPNKLYINKGGFEFEDVTKKAGVGNHAGWHNGVSLVDINEDGFLDIYVCRGGGEWQRSKSLRTNLLYINNGDLTFTENAVQYGLDDSGFSFHAAFFDYDNDNDLDMYLINHPKQSKIQIPVYQKGMRDWVPDEKDKLYRNDGNGKFSDITIEAGLKNTYGFGLSVTCADVDNNGFTDIYVSNDYTQRDHLWMNEGGKFQDQIKDRLRHIPMFAMGTDIVDVNGDGLEDIFTVEMLPNDYKKSKTSMASMNTARFEQLVDNGFHHQYMHNMFQLNQGSGRFSEVAQQIGLDKTDWSWACFFSDFDNDSDRDLFVSNGYRRETLDKDSGAEIKNYLIANKVQLDKLTPKMIEDINKMVPVQKLQNVFFSNTGDFSFTNSTSSVLPSKISFSNGAALADLDNDGDLDIVINNLDEPAFIYENNANSNGNNYVRVKLLGPKGNAFGIGAKVKLVTAGKEQFFQVKSTRGYLSSVDPVVHFGMGKTEQIDKVEVVWPDQRVSELTNVSPNQIIEVKYENASSAIATSGLEEEKYLVKDITNEAFAVPYKHKENEHEDYRLQILLPHELSTLGPFMSVGDVNSDGLEDFYVGGPHKAAGTLYLQNKEGRFQMKQNAAFEKDKEYEDMSSLFFDADGDKDLDLYVVSGGTEKFQDTLFYNDRLYVNDGKGNFTKNINLLKTKNSGSCVTSSDFDNDGDLDLFVGGRVIPDLYPIPPGSYLLRNDNGVFNDLAGYLGKDFKYQGMVTDAIWVDLNSDGYEDLITVGEWMPINIFMNSSGQNFTNQTATWFSQKTSGWWNSIEKADLDGDGDMDFIVGNLGENYKFKASEEKPFKIYATDFDRNGTCDVLLAKYSDGKEVPVRGRQCMSQQMPEIANTFPTYSKFADAGMGDIIGDKKENSYNYEAVIFSSVILWNEQGKFRIEKLPKEAQVSPVNGIIPIDYDKDGKLDIITAGNMYGSEIETTRADAGIGNILQNTGSNFKAIPAQKSDLYLQYDVKDLKKIKLANGKTGVLVGGNDDILRLLEMN